ncbi:MAG TPA: HutD family protein [Rhizobiaceae bacterium]
MRILRAGNYRRMRWKNGGGETAEIAVFPEGAGLDDFGWRVSMATVEASGPFSVFPEVDRTLCVLEGKGIILTVQGRIPMGLTSRSDPLTFPADVPTSAALIAGPITDLNVMTRRGLYRHEVNMLELVGPMEIALEGPALLFCRSGRVLVGIGGRQEKLGRFDAAILSETYATLGIEGRGQLYVIEFSPA